MFHKVHFIYEKLYNNNEVNVCNYVYVNICKLPTVI